MEHLTGKYYPEIKSFQYDSLAWGTGIIKKIGWIYFCEDGSVSLQGFMSDKITIDGKGWKLINATNFGSQENPRWKVVLQRGNESIVCFCTKEPRFATFSDGSAWKQQ